MTENTNMTEVANTTSSRGAQWAGAGSLIALAAQSLLGNGGGGGLLSNALGGGCSAQNGTIATLMQENAILKADAATDKKLVDVYTQLRAQDKAQDKLSYDIDKRLTALETAAPLREQILTGRIDNVALVAQNGINVNSAAIQCLQNTVNGLTKTVVPNSSVCPGWGNVTISPATSA